MRSNAWLEFSGCLAAVLSAVGAFAAAPDVRTVACRGFGTLSVSRERGTRADVTVVKLESSERAARFASKRQRDLEAFGDLVRQSGSWAVWGLEGVGFWGLGVGGDTVAEAFAETREAVVAELSSRKLSAPADRAYPPTLDCFDNDAVALWGNAGGRTWDLPYDFQFVQKHGLALCQAKPNVRLIEQGLVDTSAFDWMEAMADRYDVDYRQLAFPADWGWLWNRAPLPYVKGADGFVDQTQFFRLFVGTMGWNVPVAQMDRLRWDYRRQLAKRFGESSRLVGWHGCDEIPTASVNDLSAIARMDETSALWRKLGHTGPVPCAEDFLGGGEKLDLCGVWQQHADPEAKGLAEQWQTNPPADGWFDGEASDAGILMYRNSCHRGPRKGCPYWMRRRFTVPAGKKDACRYLHGAVAHLHRDHTKAYDVWVNGVKCPSVALKVDWSLCWDLGAALKEGENEIVLDTKGQNLPGYFFANATPLRAYFDMTEAENARWFEAIEFMCAVRANYIEGELRAIRSVDPLRPIKLMATHHLYDHTLKLCLKYGAYQHDTGGAGAFWAPMQGDGYSRSHRLPFSCEQGGPPDNAADLRASVTRYLNYGNSAADLVFSVSHYTSKPDIRTWLEDNIELVRTLGKVRQPDPKIAVLRTTRMFRYGFEDIWNWDIGRGTVQAGGRTQAYLESCDLLSPEVLARYAVIVDDASFMLTDAELAGLKRWVEAGGTFVAQHHTGRHSVSRRDAWPFLKAFGLADDKKDVTGIRVGRGRVIRLGTPRYAHDPKWFDDLFLRLGIEKDFRPPAKDCWGETFGSKNGVYDVYLTSFMTSMGGKEGRDRTTSFAAEFRRATPPKGVRDFGVKGHPVVDAVWSNGWFRTPMRDYVAMESRVYAAPADDPGGAMTRWLTAFAELWRPVARVDWREPPVAVPDDVLDLRDGWRVDGRTVRLGSLLTMGLCESADWTLVRTVRLPETWRGDKVRLVFDAPAWMTGLAPQATLLVDGQPAAVRQPIVPDRVNAFQCDVTAEASDGTLELALTVFGSRGPLRHTPAGALGAFYLRRLSEPSSEEPLKGLWYASVDLGERSRTVTVGEKAPHNFYVTEFAFDAATHAGERVQLRAESDLTSLCLNGTLIGMPGGLKEFDVTNLVKDGRNELRVYRPGGISNDYYLPRGDARLEKEPLPNLSLVYFKNNQTKENGK